MLIEVSFARARYTTLEDVPMRVRLVNDGPVTIPITIIGA
jgi:D-Tyr-tRNAtyr deacylase